MSLHVLLKVTIEAEFLLTNVTREPSAFIVRLPTDGEYPFKAFRTVSFRFILSTVTNCFPQ